MQDRADSSTRKGVDADVGKPKSHKWWIGGITFLVLVMVSSVVAQFRTIPLRVSVETTYVTEPLKLNGDVGLLPALEQRMYSDQIATEENGFRLVLQRLGPDPDTSPEELRVICQKIGMSPSAVKSDMSYEAPASFLARYARGTRVDINLIKRLDAEQQGKCFDELDESGAAYNEKDDSRLVAIEKRTSILEGRTSIPWTESDLPMMEGWLKKNNAALDLIAKAVRKPRFEIPYASTGTDYPFEGISTTEIWRIRSFHQGLVTRANYRLGTGDIDGAIDDMVTCQILNGHLWEQYAMHNCFPDFGSGTVGSAGIAGDLENRPTKQQLERLRHELKSAGDNKRDLDTFSLYIRLCAIDYIRHLANGGERNPYQPYDNRLAQIKNLGIDWNVVAREVNAFFDGWHPGELLDERLIIEDPSFMDWLSLHRRSKLISPMFCVRSQLVVLENISLKDCSDNLQQIVLAMLIYEKNHGSLPPAYTVDNSGKPLHSWRVLLLPYLGQQELYDQIKLDEPWDSPHNKHLHSVDVPVYKCASDHDSQTGGTNYSVVVGPDTAFGKQGGKKLPSFGPESDDLILVVERVDKNVCWLDPTQELTQAVAEKGIYSGHSSGVQVGRRDGSVEFLHEFTRAELLQKKLRGTSKEYGD